MINDRYVTGNSYPAYYTLNLSYMVQLTTDNQTYRTVSRCISLKSLDHPLNVHVLANVKTNAAFHFPWKTELGMTEFQYKSENHRWISLA